MVIFVEKEASCKKAKKCRRKSKPFLHPTQHRTTSESCFLSSKAVRTKLLTVQGTTNSEFEKQVTSVLNSPFHHVCGLLKNLDLDSDNDLISETILQFSLVIYGLPECSREDLPLAVYFFIEDTFGISSKIVLCVKLHEDGDSTVIGVVFETIRMKYSVLKNDALLDGAEVRIRDNKELKWIVDAFNAN